MKILKIALCASIFLFFFSCDGPKLDGRFVPGEKDKLPLPEPDGIVNVAHKNKNYRGNLYTEQDSLHKVILIEGPYRGSSTGTFIKNCRPTGITVSNKGLKIEEVRCALF